MRLPFVFLLPLAAAAGGFIEFQDVPPSSPVRLSSLTNEVSGASGGSVVSVNGQTGAVVLAASDVGALRAANGTASVSLSANGTLSVKPDGQHGVHIHSGGISGYASDGTVYTLDFPATGGDTIALKSQVDEKADTADLGTAAYADADGFAQLNGDEQQDFAVSQLTVVNGIDASACDIETVAITAAGESGEHTLHSYRWEYRPEAYLDGDREISVKEDLLDGTYPLVTKSGASVTLDNHRRNLVTVSGAVSLSVNWASHADFDAVLYLDIQSGGTVNWSGVTSGMTVMQPKGNGALQYEAGKKYIVGLTKIGTSSIALSKQELEAAQ